MGLPGSALAAVHRWAKPAAVLAAGVIGWMASVGIIAYLHAAESLLVISIVSSRSAPTPNMVSRPAERCPLPRPSCVADLGRDRHVCVCAPTGRAWLSSRAPPSRRPLLPPCAPFPATLCGPSLCMQTTSVPLFQTARTSVDHSKWPTGALLIPAALLLLSAALLAWPPSRAGGQRLGRVPGPWRTERPLLDLEKHPWENDPDALCAWIPARK